MTVKACTSSINFLTPYIATHMWNIHCINHQNSNHIGSPHFCDRCCYRWDCLISDMMVSIIALCFLCHGNRRFIALCALLVENRVRREQGVLGSTPVALQNSKGRPTALSLPQWCHHGSWCYMFSLSPDFLLWDSKPSSPLLSFH